jgi:hypothetical protein
VRQRTELLKEKAYNDFQLSAAFQAAWFICGDLEDIRATHFHFNRISHETFNNDICFVCRVKPCCL